MQVSTEITNSKVPTVAKRESLKAIESRLLEDTDNITATQSAALTRAQPHQTQDRNRHLHICTAAQKISQCLLSGEEFRWRVEAVEWDYIQVKKKVCVATNFSQVHVDCSCFRYGCWGNNWLWGFLILLLEPKIIFFLCAEELEKM